MTNADSLPVFRPIAMGRAGPKPRKDVINGLKRAIVRLRLWRDRYNDRRTIRSMTSEQIADLDLDPLALRREGEKPFWRA